MQEGGERRPVDDMARQEMSESVGMRQGRAGRGKAILLC